MSGATVMAPRTSAGLSKKSGGKLTSGMANGKGGPPSKLNSFVSSNTNDQTSSLPVAAQRQ